MDSRKICPCCNGDGTIPIPKSGQKHKAKAEVILKLKEAGYTIREIMKQLGYKSTSAIAHYIKPNSTTSKTEGE